MKNIIVTGGCGFIGHHLVEHIIRNTDWNVIVIDKLSYSSKGLDRLRSANLINHKRIKVFTFDFTTKMTEGLKQEIGEVDYIAHLGAESHVDNSISNPRDCFKDNIFGTIELLEYAKTLKKLKLFFYFSTDEVFGPALNGTSFKEWDRHNPTNPYSASKSAAENICLAYSNTYKLPIIIVNNMNVFGERQYIEKFIPNTIKKILNNETVLIHSYQNKKKSGTRFYIHARNVASCILFLIEKGKVSEKYNITGEKEVSNYELALLISEIMGKKLNYEMIDFHSSRPGHDLRYALTDENLKALGWSQPSDFENSLKKTVEWTLENKEWLEY
jgi:dTDP-glucose 4,6-dehydratase